MMGQQTTTSMPDAVFTQSTQTNDTIASSLQSTGNTAQGSSGFNYPPKHHLGPPFDEYQISDRSKRQRLDQPCDDTFLNKSEAKFCQHWLDDFCDNDVFPSESMVEALAELIRRPPKAVVTYYRRNMSTSQRDRGQWGTSLASSTRYGTPAPFVAFDQQKKPKKHNHGARKRSLNVQTTSVTVPTPTASRSIPRQGNHSRSTRCKGRSNTLKTPQQLEHSKEEPYQCTHGCGKRFRIKDSWHRHEEIWFPQREWLCLFDHVEFRSESHICKYCKKPGADAKHIRQFHLGELLKVGNSQCCSQIIRGRKDKVKQHYKAVHGKVWTNNGFAWNTFVHACEYDVPYDSGWACGFCPPNSVFKDWHEWLRHVGDHFTQGCSMKEWQGERSELEELAGVQDDNSNYGSPCEEDHRSHENGSEGAVSNNDRTDSCDEDEGMSSGGAEDSVLPTRSEAPQQVRPPRPSLCHHLNAPGGG